MKLLLVASVFVFTLIIALVVKNLLEGSVIKKKNKVQPFIIQEAATNNQIQQVPLNNNSHNPEIISTSMSNVISLISILLVVYLIYNQYWYTASNFLALSKEFVVIQYELVPYWISSFCVPLALYFQNKNFRKFIKTYYKSVVDFR